jgi:hypothetical protein
MPLSHLLKRINQPSPARASSVDAGTGPSSEYRNELSQPPWNVAKPTVTLVVSGWEKKTTPTDDCLLSSPPFLSSSLPQTSTAENTTPEAGSEAREMPPPMPLPVQVGPSVLPNLSTEPLPEMISSSQPAPDRLTETWDMIKDGPSNSNMNQRFSAFSASWVAKPSFQRSTLTLTFR